MCVWLLIYILATSKVTPGWAQLVSVHTHGDLLVLTHWETKLSTL